MKLAAILAATLILTGCADLDPIMGRTPEGGGGSVSIVT